jgi:hypothetical protein
MKENDLIGLGKKLDKDFKNIKQILKYNQDTINKIIQAIEILDEKIKGAK